MKIIKNIAVILVLFTCVSFAQQQPEDLQKVKEALVNQVLYTQALEKDNISLKAQLQQVGIELKAVKTMAQLDSLKIVWGIEPKKKGSK